MAPKKKPTGELKDQRVPIMMSEDELKAIDDWSFANRIRSRGEAIRRLCQIGLNTSSNAKTLAAGTIEVIEALKAAWNSPDPAIMTSARFTFAPWVREVYMVGATAELWTTGETIDAIKPEMEKFEEYIAAHRPKPNAD